MESKLVLGVVLAAAITLVVALMLPGGGAPEQSPKLPWQIDLYPGGISGVFGLRLGQSTLSEALALLHPDGKTTLFVNADGIYAIEVFFHGLNLSGLRADLVLTLDVDQAEADEIYRRGLRESRLGSGTRKVELAADDRSRLLSRNIQSITYIPAADLDADLVKSRFGPPDRKIGEKSGITHWLYPDKGLDVILNPHGKEVFQYVAPKAFGRLTAPLEQTIGDVPSE